MILQIGTSEFVIAGLAMGFMFLGTLVWVASRYRRVPVGKVLVVLNKSEGGKRFQCFSTGRVFVWPILQDYRYLSLDPIVVRCDFYDAATRTDLQRELSCTFKVAIGRESDLHDAAAVNLLGLPAERIASKAQDVLLTQLRHAVGSLGIDEIKRRRAEFTAVARSTMERELNKIGLKLLEFNIPGVSDDLASQSLLSGQNSPMLPTADQSMLAASTGDRYLLKPPG